MAFHATACFQFGHRSPLRHAKLAWRPSCARRANSTPGRSRARASSSSLPRGLPLLPFVWLAVSLTVEIWRLPIRCLRDQARPAPRACRRRLTQSTMSPFGGRPGSTSARIEAAMPCSEAAHDIHMLPMPASSLSGISTTPRRRAGMPHARRAISSRRQRSTSPGYSRTTTDRP